MVSASKKMLLKLLWNLSKRCQQCIIVSLLLFEKILKNTEISKIGINRECNQWKSLFSENNLSYNLL